jgi:hypothetical protein
MDFISIVLEFFSFIVQIVLWMIFFEIVLSVMRNLIGKKEADKELEEAKNKLVSMIHVIKQEKHGDMFYWFDNDNDQFLAQGATKEEIIAHLKSRFPTHIFITDDGTKAIKGPTWQIMPIEDLTKNIQRQN